MGTPCYVIGVTKQIRKRIGKNFGDIVEVVLQERDIEKDVKRKCPKCGREFKKKEQGHYCGEKPRSIDEYILSQDEEKQEDLRNIRQILRSALPEPEHSWGMRRMVVDNYLVCDMVDPGVVTVTDVLYGASNIHVRLGERHM